MIDLEEDGPLCECCGEPEPNCDSLGLCEITDVDGFDPETGPWHELVCETHGRRLAS